LGELLNAVLRLLFPVSAADEIAVAADLDGTLRCGDAASRWGASRPTRPSTRPMAVRAAFTR
jgi:hypothetical protein